MMKRKLLIMFAAKACGSLLLSDVIDSNITVLPHTHAHTYTTYTFKVLLSINLAFGMETLYSE